MSDAEIRRVFETNVFGTMAVTRAVLPHMRESRQGRIVIMTSISGRIGAMALSAYSSTKFALEGFGEALSLEVAPLGLSVSLVEPGLIQTEIWGSNRHVAHHVAQHAGSHKSPYWAWFNNLEALTDKLIRSSPTTMRDVAVVVHEALVATRPRLRYLVGRRAKMLYALRRYLPDGLFEWLYFRASHRAIGAVE